jgi:hypothetical protein
VTSLVLLACSGSDDEPSPTARPAASSSPAAAATTVGDAAQRAQNDAGTSLPGAFVRAHPGPDGRAGTIDDRAHVAANISIPICTAEQVRTAQIVSPLCYHSNPPTSGPHGLSPAAFRVLETAAPKEALVHNMEHGGVVIWVNTTNQQVVIELAAITNAALNARRLVVMSPYFEMEPETIALTSWTRIDKFPVSQFTPERVAAFIVAHDRRYNPENF